MPEAQGQVEIPIPNKPKWDCQITTPPKDEKGFTVGEVFTFGCEGAAPLQLKEPLTIVLPEKLHHSLVLLKPLEVTDRKISYQATSYRAGQVKLPFVDVSDAQGGGFISQPLEIKVASVIDQKQPPQNIFGPISPLKMEYPSWLLFAVLVFLGVLISWSLVFFRRRIQRKNLEKNIKKFQSPMGSYHQFSKDVRLLKRGVLFSNHVAWSEDQKRQYLAKLEEAYRMFILREYIVPADRWPVNMIIKHVRRKDRIHCEKYMPAVKKAFRELERAAGAIESLTSMDIEQITVLCTQAVDAMWKSKMSSGTGR